MLPLYAGQVIIIGVLLFASWKYGKLRHPATYLADSRECIYFFTGAHWKIKNRTAIFRNDH